MAVYVRVGVKSGGDGASGALTPVLEIASDLRTISVPTASSPQDSNSAFEETFDRVRCGLEESCLASYL